jgi:hypothetical protein
MLVTVMIQIPTGTAQVESEWHPTIYEEYSDLKEDRK